jgi:hypothetical protein
MVWLLATGLAPTGCSRPADEPTAVEVTGTVTLEGKPLAQARVTFVPTDASVGGPSAAADTNEAGWFRLEGLDGRPGAVAGRYRVTVEDRSQEASSAVANSRDTSALISAIRQKKQPRIPQLYADPELTPLRAEVIGGGSFKFQLKQRPDR